MEKLVIDRQIWLRGEGEEASFLLRKTDGKMCCLGIYLLQRGVEPEHLMGVATPDDLLDHHIEDHPKFPDWMVIEGNRNSQLINSPITNRLMSINDATIALERDQDGMPEPNPAAVDEARLAATFAEVGVEVEFVN